MRSHFEKKNITLLVVVEGGVEVVADVVVTDVVDTAVAKES